MPLQYLDPRSPVVGAPEPYALSLDPDTTGLRIGFVANTFPDADRFSRHVATALQQLLPRMVPVFVQKPSVSPSDDTLRAELHDGCDAAVIAYGHCGSCTSGTVRDGMTLAREGLPSVSLVTEKFWEQATRETESGRLPGLPMVRTPYPLAGAEDAYLAAVARSIAPQIVQQLRGRGAQAA